MKGHKVGRIKPWSLTHRSEKDAELANLKDREKIQNYELDKVLGIEEKDKRRKKLPKWMTMYPEEIKKLCRHCDHEMKDHSLQVSKYHDKCNIQNCLCEYFLIKY